MEQIPNNIQSEESNEKPSRLGGMVKKTLTAAGVAGLTLGAMELKHSVEEQEKWAQENPIENLAKERGDISEISSLKNNPNIDPSFKFYFHPNIHDENGVKWVRIIAENNADFDAITTNPAIINFLEQNPDEESAFLRKNESGQLELVRESGEIVKTL